MSRLKKPIVRWREYVWWKIVPIVVCTTKEGATKLIGSRWNTTMYKAVTLEALEQKRGVKVEKAG